MHSCVSCCMSSEMWVLYMETRLLPSSAYAFSFSRAIIQPKMSNAVLIALAKMTVFGQSRCFSMTRSSSHASSVSKLLCTSKKMLGWSGEQALMTTSPGLSRCGSFMLQCRRIHSITVADSLRTPADTELWTTVAFLLSGRNLSQLHIQNVTN